MVEVSIPSAADASGEDAHGAVSLGMLEDLLGAESREAAMEWGVDVLAEQVETDLIKAAVARDGLLIPTASTNGGKTGPRHGIAIATTVLGQVHESGEGCVIDDLQDVRGAAAETSASTTPTPPQPDLAYRSLVCAPIEGVGVFALFCREPGVFDATDLATAAAVGRAVASVTAEMIATDGEDAEANERIEEIRSVLSHDLPNKVNVASGHLELAELTGDGKHFTVARNALEGIESMVEMVVALAESGDPITSKEEIDLAAIAERTYEPLDSATSMLRVDASATVVADRACLAQILENLFRNAIDHTDGSVCIEVGVLEDGFYVADDGPGIASAIREEALDPGVSTDQDHQGMGLSIVHELAAAHGWTVSLSDAGSDDGARVEIRGVTVE